MPRMESRTETLKPPTQPQRAQAGREEEIARVAYALYLQRGGDHGHDFEDWLNAEAIVRKQRP